MKLKFLIVVFALFAFTSLSSAEINTSAWLSAEGTEISLFLPNFHRNCQKNLRIRSLDP